MIKKFYDYLSKQYGFVRYAHKGYSSMLHVTTSLDDQYTKIVKPEIHRTYDGEFYVKSSKQLAKQLQKEKFITTDQGVCVNVDHIVSAHITKHEEVTVESEYYYPQFSLFPVILTILFLGWTIGCLIAGLFFVNPGVALIFFSASVSSV